ncbi:MAG: Rab family GTPase [Candidatus Njordarchaeota archaeon]
MVYLKSIVLGDAAVGKTSLIKRFAEGRFEKSYKATIGADVYITNYFIPPDIQSKIAIWDLAGQQQFKYLIQTMDGYFHKARIVLLVYDITRAYTFNSIPEWYALAINKGLNPNEVIFILVENKVDLEDYREVPPDAGDELVKKLNLHGFVKTSALTGYNVEVAFKEAVTKLVKLLIERIKKRH